MVWNGELNGIPATADKMQIHPLFMVSLLDGCSLNIAQVWNEIKMIHSRHLFTFRPDVVLLEKCLFLVYPGAIMKEKPFNIETMPFLD